jgi:hypothetical protein
MSKSDSFDIKKILEERKKAILITSIVLIVLGLLVFGLTNFSSDSDKPKPAVESKLSKEQIDKFIALGYINQPTNVPTGYKRTLVEVVPASKTSTGCEEVLQRFLVDSDISSDFIDVYSYLVTCEFPRPLDALGFTVGNYTGWVSDENKKESVLIEIGVNGNRVRIDSDLETSQLTPMLGSFVPFDGKSPKDSLNLTSK